MSTLEVYNMVKLADSEWKIMELLWNRGAMTTMELSRALEDSEGWSRSTVITLLNRMVDKGSLYFETENKTKKYYSAIDRNETGIEESKSFLNRFFNGNIGLMISSLIKQDVLTDQEMEDLQRILREDK